MRGSSLSANPKEGGLTEICLIALALIMLSFVELRAWFHWEGYAVAQVPGSAGPPGTLAEINPFERCAAEARAAEREARVALGGAGGAVVARRKSRGAVLRPGRDGGTVVGETVTKKLYS
jgi:hypothetical protein